VQLGDTSTNYQIMPGDRIFVSGISFMDDLKASLFPCAEKQCPKCACPPTGCNPAALPVADYAHEHFYEQQIQVDSIPSKAPAAGDALDGLDEVPIETISPTGESLDTDLLPPQHTYLPRQSVPTAR
jgi:hypothetical protein